MDYSVECALALTPYLKTVRKHLEFELAPLTLSQIKSRFSSKVGSANEKIISKYNSNVCLLKVHAYNWRSMNPETQIVKPQLHPRPINVQEIQ